MIVWIAGTALGGDAWSFIGAFSTEELAGAACIDAADFVGPVELDAVAPREPTPWPGAYRPRARE